jgi:4-diphosphocytidyl-2-C-methyl-D-erythritol kinase
MRILAPAKINLYLRIVGRRADGYHLLDSLMVPVSLYDEILIETERVTETEIESGEQRTESGERRAGSEGAKINVICDDPTVPGDETNLAYKAAALLCKEAGVQAKITIDLRKHIPSGAGLGGGSSDAAAVLKAVNTLLSLGFTEPQLCTFAVRLGADVPFFIPCRPALVGGIGEVLTPIPPLPSRWLVLVVPSFGVSTAWAYRRFDELPLLESSSGSRIRFVPGQWPSSELLVNDLEWAVLPEYPIIQQIKEALLAYGAGGALMSGSGSSVFGVFQHHAEAERAIVALRDKGKTFLVEPLAEPSPTG